MTGQICSESDTEELNCQIQIARRRRSDGTLFTLREKPSKATLYSLTAWNQFVV